MEIVGDNDKNENDVNVDNDEPSELEFPDSEVDEVYIPKSNQITNIQTQITTSKS